MSDQLKVDLLFKKQFGVVNAHPLGPMGAEPPVSARPAVLASDLWAQSVPTTAPTDLVPDATFVPPGGTGGGTRSVSSSYPYLAKYENCILATGTEGPMTSQGVSYAFDKDYTNYLVGAIPFNYDAAGTYGVTVTVGGVPYQMTGGSYNWVLDRDAGYLIFLTNTPISFQVKISFWRYEGAKGTYGNATISPVVQSMTEYSYTTTSASPSIRSMVNNPFAFGSSSFTIECFFKLTEAAAADKATNAPVLSIGTAGMFPSGFGQEIRITQTARILVPNNTNDGDLVYAPTNPISVGTWYHLALVRNGNSLSLYVNGVAVTFTSSTGTGAVNVTATPATSIATSFNFTNPVNQLTLFSGPYPLDSHTKGSLQSVRVVRGQALYTANFTAPTNPVALTAATVGIGAGATAAITGTIAFLTDTSNTINDISPYNLPLSATNDITVSGGVYTNASATGSILGTFSPFLFGRSPFTIECFFKLTEAAAAGNSLAPILSIGTAGVNSSDFGQEIRITQTARILVPNNTNDADLTYAPTNPISVGTWYHLALVRNDNSLSLYVNGVAVSFTSATGTGAVTTPTSTIATSFNFTNPTCELMLFSDPYPADTHTKGSLQRVRIVRDQALYTANFTAPTNPASLTATAVGGTGAGAAVSITGTIVFLTDASNTIRDVSPYNLPISATNDIAVSGGVYTNASATGSILGTFSPLSFGSSSFTIECFFKPSVAKDTLTPILSIGTGGVSGGIGREIRITQAFGILVPNDTNTGDNFYYATQAPLSVGTWYHLALVRDGNTLSLYRNGAAVAFNQTTIGGVTSFPATPTTDITTSFNFTNPTSPLMLFSDPYPIDPYSPGSIEGVRIVRGQALYKDNFTPPTRLPLSIAGTTGISGIVACLLGGTSSIVDRSAYAVPLTLKDVDVVTTSIAKSFTVEGQLNPSYETIPGVLPAGTTGYVLPGTSESMYVFTILLVGGGGAGAYTNGTPNGRSGGGASGSYLNATLVLRGGDVVSCSAAGIGAVINVNGAGGNSTFTWISNGTTTTLSAQGGNSALIRSTPAAGSAASYVCPAPAIENDETSAGNPGTTLNGTNGGSGGASLYGGYGAGGNGSTTTGTHNAKNGSAGFVSVTWTAYLPVLNQLTGNLSLYTDVQGPQTNEKWFNTLEFNNGGYTAGIKAVIPAGSWGDALRMDFFNPQAGNDVRQATRMSIVPYSGNVGIGTTAPAYKLDVAGTGNFTGTLTAADNVGIGTTTPAHKLDVNGTTRITKNLVFGTVPDMEMNNYNMISMSGGNSRGYLFGSYNSLGDGIHLSYNYLQQNNAGTYIPASYGGTSRISLQYGQIDFGVGGSNTQPTTRMFLNTSGLNVTGGINPITAVSDVPFTTSTQGSLVLPGSPNTVYTITGRLVGGGGSGGYHTVGGVGYFACAGGGSGGYIDFTLTLRPGDTINKLVQGTGGVGGVNLNGNGTLSSFEFTPKGGSSIKIIANGGYYGTPESYAGYTYSYVGIGGEITTPTYSGLVYTSSYAGTHAYTKLGAGNGSGYGTGGNGFPKFTSGGQEYYTFLTVFNPLASGGDGLAVVTVTKQTINNNSFSGDTVLNNGYVGIGTTAPEYPLDLMTTGINYVARFNGGILASAYGQNSDRRIKTNISSIGVQDSLQTLRKVEVVQYSLKDSVQHGSQKTIGFIAQQVAEQVSHAVNQISGTVPTVYSICNVSSYTASSAGSTNTFYLSQTDPLNACLSSLNQSTTLSVYLADNTKIKAYVASSENSTLTLLSDQFIPSTMQSTQVFVYGEEVNDYNVLEADQLYSLNVAATQALDSITQNQSTLIGDLQTTVAQQSAQISTLLAKL